jgi:peptidyl-prolyl cis-trans isomerase C
MFKTIVSTCLLLVSLSSYADPTDPVAKVNGKTITQQDYDNYAKTRIEQTGSEVKTEVLLGELLQRELLKQDALDKGLDKRPEFVEKLEYMRTNLLMAMGMHDYLSKHPLDEAALQREYDRQLANLKVPKEYRVRHILVETEAEAFTIITELDKGNSFDKLAKEKSRDTPSAKKNGDLGWITKSRVEKSFWKVIETLEKGQYTTTPVKGQFGWHIIQLDDIRTAALPPFKNVKQQIKAALQRELMQKYVSDLKSQAKIEMTFAPAAISGKE